MNVTVKAYEPVTPIVFPCLQEGPHGVVVLFESAGKGTVVRTSTSHDRIGVHAGWWDMKQFVPFKHTLVMSN